MSIQKSVIGEEVVLPIVIGGKYMFPTAVEVRHREPIQLDSMSGPFSGRSIFLPSELTVIFQENAFYQSYREAEDEVRAAKANGILKRLIQLNEEYMTLCNSPAIIEGAAQMTDEHIKLRRLADSFIQAANMTIEKAREQRIDEIAKVASSPEFRKMFGTDRNKED